MCHSSPFLHIVLEFRILWLSLFIVLFLYRFLCIFSQSSSFFLFQSLALICMVSSTPYSTIWIPVSIHLVSLLSFCHYDVIYLISCYFFYSVFWDIHVYTRRRAFPALRYPIFPMRIGCLLSKLLCLWVFSCSSSCKGFAGSWPKKPCTFSFIVACRILVSNFHDE